MSRPSRTRTLLFVAVCACLTPPPAAAQSLTPVDGTFSSPMYVTAPPGDGRRLMVVEQGGSVRVIRDGAKLADPFLSLSTDISTGGERGLLSIAFSPDYEQSRLLYAYFTDGDGDIRVDELRRAADSRDRVEPDYRKPVIEIPHPEAANHNGGTAVFGPDGLLYLATGDGGNAYDQPTRDARNPVISLLGKVLRIAPTPGGGYTIPSGNPFTGLTDLGRDEVWSYGLRNPFRFSFDHSTGDLFIGDVGQSAVEEVNHAPAASGAGRGANFGWDDCEGNLAAEPSTGTAPCPLSGDLRPALSLFHVPDGYQSVIGGVVVRDPSVPQLVGRYLYGDFYKARLRSYIPGSPETDREEPALAVGQLTGIGTDACGRVHAVQIGGAVLRLDGGPPGDCVRRVAEPGSGDPGGGGVLPTDPVVPSAIPAPAAPVGGSVVAAPTALRLSLGVALRQRLTRRGLLVRVRCSKPCRLRALGTLSLRRDGRRIGLRQVHRSLTASLPAALRLKLSDASRSAVRRALARGRRVSATISVRARDAGGILRTARRTVFLQR